MRTFWVTRDIGSNEITLWLDLYPPRMDERGRYNGALGQRASLAGEVAEEHLRLTHDQFESLTRLRIYPGECRRLKIMATTL